MESNIVFPEYFDGVFRFTNWTEEDFTAKWNNVAYTFPALKTSPMTIMGATPEEVQNIRKKFAKELAEREFYRTERFKGLENQTKPGESRSFHQAAIYAESDLNPFIEKCLEPLPIANTRITTTPNDIEKKLRKDNKGKNVTRVLEENESLVGDGTVLA